MEETDGSGRPTELTVVAWWDWWGRGIYRCLTGSWTRVEEALALSVRGGKDSDIDVITPLYYRPCIVHYTVLPANVPGIII